jgi:hypothetical protein
MSQIQYNSFNISILVLVLSAIASISNYFLIVKREHVDTSLINSIPLGEQHYALFHKDSCVGEFRSKLSDNSGSYGMELSGNVALKVGDALLNPSMTGYMEFNSLGQMAGSLFDFKLAEDKLHIGTKEIDPLIIRLSWGTDLKDGERLLSLPGVFQIKKTSKNIYKLDYSQLQRLKSNYFQLPIFNSLSKSEFKFEKINLDNNLCKEKNPLDTTNVLKDLSTLRGFIDNNTARLVK